MQRDRHRHGAKVDLVVRKDRPFSHNELARQRLVEIEGVDVAIVSAEDLVLAKLEWSSQGGGSERQLRDIAGIAAVSSLDRAYLERWATELGVADLLRTVLPDESASPS